jgi:murein DD-endopeptidase MepM/ murein hydrolase activator NlpD
MFGVTKATIMAANDLTPGQGLKEGIVLTILPVSGREHTVKKGDTIASIAKKYKVAVDDIVFFNDLDEEGKLSIGEVIIIPDPDFDTLPAIPVTVKKSSGSNGASSGTSVKAPSFRDPSKPDLGNAILRPVDLGASHLTQFAHGWNRSGVDIGAPTGTPIKAAYHGTVVVATEVGYNGGYGKYVVIDHDIEGRTVRTIYGHMNSVTVSPGQSVSRGQTIGTVGSTGNSTGPHLHFEVRGALNPLTKNRNYTGLGY